MRVAAPIPTKALRLIPLLATEHVGELVNTRDALVRALADAGLDLHDLAQACISVSAGPEPTRSASTTWSPGRASFGDIARAARDSDRGRLSPRERCFVSEMCGKGFAFRPSPRQAAWLGDIFDRLQGRAAA